MLHIHRVAADAGHAAVAIESGKRKAACFRWACNKRLRQAVVTLADTTRHHNPWAQDTSAAARARGHDHPRAIRTLGRAWCRILWRCWQDRMPYDPARHRALQQHITVTIPTPSGPRPDLAATQRMAGAAVTQRAGRRAEREALTTSRHPLSRRGVDTGRPRTRARRSAGGRVAKRTTCNSEPEVDARLSIRIGIAEAALNQRLAGPSTSSPVALPLLNWVRDRQSPAGRRYRRSSRAQEILAGDAPGALRGMEHNAERADRLQPAEHHVRLRARNHAE